MPIENAESAEVSVRIKPLRCAKQILTKALNLNIKFYQFKFLIFI